MSDGCSSGPVVLTLAGPRPFLLVLVLHCPGRVRFFEILATVPLLSSINMLVDEFRYGGKMVRIQPSLKRRLYWVLCIKYLKN